MSGRQLLPLRRGLVLGVGILIALLRWFSEKYQVGALRSAWVHFMLLNPVTEKPRGWPISPANTVV